MPLRMIRDKASAAVGAASRGAVLSDIEEAGVGVFWATDSEGALSYLSAQALELIGVPEEELLGSQITELLRIVERDESKSSRRPLGFQLRARTSFNNLVVELDGRGADGSKRKILWRISGRACKDKNGKYKGYRGVATDVTREYSRQQEAEQQARVDPLTGLANRRRTQDELTRKLRASKLAKRSCAVMMLDLDRFKQVNDTLGHPAGDELLKQVAQRLKNVIKEAGEIGRLGGDEFMVILPDMDDRGTLGDLAGRVIQMLSQPYSLHGQRTTIGASVGIAIAPYDGLEPDELTSAVDLALYEAKRSGRGVYRFYVAELRNSAAEGHEIEEALRDALAKGELRMFYQPLVDPKGNHVRAFEALMRWEHPEMGWVSPKTFIPIAEQTDLIVQLGNWAIRQACEDAAQWPGDLQVAVNVSPRQFMDEHFPRTVATALASSGLDPDCLDLEITESVFVGDVDAVDAMFASLKKLGVRLSMDDFGTGYSSLGYLNRAPFDKIKIDQSFVRGCTQGGNNPAIISAVVGLANALDMQTVAEGVEAMDELALVTERGADLVQGYIYSKPMTHAELVERFADGVLTLDPSGPPRFRSDRFSVFRKVGLIHEDFYYTVTMRNLSKSGARIEGLVGVPKGTQFVLDLGSGQLVVCKVVRADEASQGLHFETELISDGADGLMTRHRVSPYALAAGGMPLAALPAGNYPLADKMKSAGGTPSFVQVEV